MNKTGMILVLTLFFANAFAKEEVYFVKQDAVALTREDNEHYRRFYRGESVRCSEEKGECCFMAMPGTVCIVSSKLSRNPVSSADLFIAGVYSSLLDDEKGACVGKKKYRDSDAFTWSYGINVGGDVRGEVAVIGAFFIEKNGLLVKAPVLRKITVISKNSDNVCVELNIAKKDIADFLAEYHKISRDLNVEQDLNIYLQGEFQVFSPVFESDLSNNSVAVNAVFPADSEISWPSNPITRKK